MLRKLKKVQKAGYYTVRLLTNRKKKKIGQPPGTLVYTGEQKMENVQIRLINYDGSSFDEKELESVDDIKNYKETPETSWINIDGLHEVEKIGSLGESLGIHPLVLEDILSVGQRPKMDDYDEYLFITLRMFYFSNGTKDVTTEQVSIVLFKNLIITFQEKEGDVFEAVRERLRAGKGKIRKNGADYLAYALIDSIVDSYFQILEKFGEDIEDLEEELITKPRDENLHAIHRLRREMIFLRKSVWPLREVISLMQRRDSPLIKKNTELFLRDVYDHTIQVIDTIESYRDIISGMLDTYLSSVSNRMNEVMKTLTLIATIFIPLTFIAGVYGMNFEHFPELKWDWIYPNGFWISVFIIAGIMVFYFKRKKWL